MNDRLRPPQEEVVAYAGGLMGVSAVPGSGKTFTLSHLAAALVERLADQGLSEEQEVLIVTFTNSAVNSFRHRIGQLVRQERGLLPYVGYRVRTLHGLAHDIVRGRPGLVGLEEGFDIVDERVSTRIMREIAEGWARQNADFLLDYIAPEFMEDDYKLRRLLGGDGVQLIVEVAGRFVKQAKDERKTVEELRALLDGAAADLPLARMGLDIYEMYQRALSYRGAVDFDDLVRLALEALDLDPAYLERLWAGWPYILEDETQDSSQLQNEMLRLLTDGRNWVRVGDPNQAIYTTFTTADANFLRAFLRERGVTPRELPHSGRSAQPIIDLANALVDWAAHEHPVEDLRGALAVQHIEPTPPGDTQPNPDESFIYIDYDPEQNVTPEREIERVVSSLANWLPDHRDWTVAVLTPENQRGFMVAEALKARGIEYEELLRSTSATREAAAQLRAVVDLLAEPTRAGALATLYQEVWWPRHLGADPQTDEALLYDVAHALRSIQSVEDFMWPGPEGDWLDQSPWFDDVPLRADLTAFRAKVGEWLHAASLPIDQLILTVSRDLFDQPADLALAHKIAVVLRSIARNNPTYRLPELGGELRLIAENQRRFLGFDDAQAGYEPRKGVVTVATMHAAKGLEWDRVYLMAVSNYGFPSGQPQDTYIAERYFVRSAPGLPPGQLDHLNLEAEALEQLELLIAGRAGDYEEGKASLDARLEYAAERLRLLYVGITRAKRDLIITWNMGRYWQRGQVNQPSTPLIALYNVWKETEG
jgi:DNA helicase-2/ATP-dependent DNA helicase PcrA